MHIDHTHCSAVPCQATTTCRPALFPCYAWGSCHVHLALYRLCPHLWPGPMQEFIGLFTSPDPLSMQDIMGLFANPDAPRCETSAKTNCPDLPPLQEFIGLFSNPEFVQVGSSLKLLMVAEGEAHIYPRCGGLPAVRLSGELFHRKDCAELVPWQASTRVGCCFLRGAGTPVISASGVHFDANPPRFPSQPQPHQAGPHVCVGHGRRPAVYSPCCITTLHLHPLLRLSPYMNLNPYPTSPIRLAPTCEWDTAAADIIVREAGGVVLQAGKQDNKGNPQQEWKVGAARAGRKGSREEALCMFMFKVPHLTKTPSVY